MSAEEVAKAFVPHYYGMRANNPAGIGSLYSESSILTFEGDSFKGTSAIVGKLGSAPAVFDVKSMDIQPSVNDQSICIFVTGGLQIEVSCVPVLPCLSLLNIVVSGWFLFVCLIVELSGCFPFTYICSLFDLTLYLTARKISSLLRVLPTCSYGTVRVIHRLLGCVDF